VGTRAGLDTEDGGKILCSCRGSNPDRLVDITERALLNKLQINTKLLTNNNSLKCVEFTVATLLQHVTL
jgi:hypothetical protein